jgi:hypothetical protein
MQEPGIHKVCTRMLPEEEEVEENLGADEMTSSTSEP